MRLVKLAFLFLLPTAALANELEMATPESVGFSAERLGQIDTFVRKEIDEGRLSGVVTMVARHGKIVHFETAGDYGVNDSRSIEKDSLFRIYSMTKPITTVAAMMLYEEGMFQLNDPVSKYMPEFEDQTVERDGEIVPAASQMTIEQLMSHSAGLSYGWDPNSAVDRAYQEADLMGSRDLDEFIDKLAPLPLRFEPGTRYYYSVATDVLGALVERLSGMSLEEYFDKRIFTPLGMNDTYFNVPEDELDRLATLHYWDAEASRMAPVPYEQVPLPTNVTFFSGGGGLISTAMDYMKFSEMMRRGGSYNGVRILGPKTVQYMTIAQLTQEVRDNGADQYPSMHLYPGQSFGLGFGVITDPGQSGVVSSKGEYSWGGAANTKFWIDPEEELVAILMTSFLGSPWSDQTRFLMKSATYQALTEIAADD